MQKHEDSYLIPENSLNANESLLKLGSELGNSHMFIVKNSDSLIWEKLKNGNESALGELYSLHIDALFSYGIQLAQDRGYVMDCVHDLFVDLYKYRKNLSTTTNVKYYLFKSLKRKINKKYHRKIVPTSHGFEQLLNDEKRSYTKSHEANLIQSEHAVERNAHLSVALSTLTKKQRRGLFLRFNQEKSYAEISDIMGVSISTARTTIYRAMKTLRKHTFYN